MNSNITNKGTSKAPDDSTQSHIQATVDLSSGKHTMNSNTT